MSRQARTQPESSPLASVPTWAWIVMGLLATGNALLGSAYRRSLARQENVVVKEPIAQDTLKEKLFRENQKLKNILREIPVQLATHQPDAFFYAPTGDKLHFETYISLILKRVSISAELPGNIAIELHAADGRVLQTHNCTVEGRAEQRVLLNFPIPQGAYYLTYTGSADLLVHDQPSFPIAVPGIISLQHSDSGRFCYFYDWECWVEVKNL